MSKALRYFVVILFLTTAFTFPPIKLLAVYDFPKPEGISILVFTAFYLMIIFWIDFKYYSINESEKIGQYLGAITFFYLGLLHGAITSACSFMLGGTEIIIKYAVSCLYLLTSVLMVKQAKD
jgi:hypothetical protein